MAKKGLPKTGGRKKGQPNRQTEELRVCAERLGVDPFEVLLLFAAGDWKALGYKGEKYVASENQFGSSYRFTIDPAVRAKAASEACEYLNPKRKAIEHSAPGLEDAIKSLSDDQLDEKIKAGLEKMNAG